MRELLASAHGDQPGFELRHVFEDAESAWEIWELDPPEAAIVDIVLPGKNGVQLGVQIKRLHPAVGIVLLSSHSYSRVLERLPTDVNRGWAYLLKGESDLAMMAQAARIAVEGGMLMNTESLQAHQRDDSELTARQIEMLHLLASGLSNTAIADRMGITTKSVENGLNRIYSQVGLDVNEPDYNRRVVAAQKAINFLEVPR